MLTIMTNTGMIHTSIIFMFCRFNIYSMVGSVAYVGILMELKTSPIVTPVDLQQESLEEVITHQDK